MKDVEEYIFNSKFNRIMNKLSSQQGKKLLCLTQIEHF